MPRSKRITPGVRFNIWGMPQDLAARIHLSLYSEIEGRIPYGAVNEFFVSLVRDHFARIDATRGEGNVDSQEPGAA